MGGGGPKNFEMPHLHKFDRPLKNTQTTFEKATPRIVKWQPRGERAQAYAYASSPTRAPKGYHCRSAVLTLLNISIAEDKNWNDPSPAKDLAFGMCLCEPCELPYGPSHKASQLYDGYEPLILARDSATLGVKLGAWIDSHKLFL